jgi:hypothetical protein
MEMSALSQLECISNQKTTGSSEYDIQDEEGQAQKP